MAHGIRIPTPREAREVFRFSKCSWSAGAFMKSHYTSTRQRDRGEQALPPPQGRPCPRGREWHGRRTLLPGRGAHETHSARASHGDRRGAPAGLRPDPPFLARRPPRSGAPHPSAPRVVRGKQDHAQNGNSRGLDCPRAEYGPPFGRIIAQLRRPSSSPPARAPSCPRSRAPAGPRSTSTGPSRTSRRSSPRRRVRNPPPFSAAACSGSRLRRRCKASSSRSRWSSAPSSSFRSSSMPPPAGAFKNGSSTLASRLRPGSKHPRSWNPAPAWRSNRWMAQPRRPPT